MIVGYEQPGSGRGGIGSLLLAARSGHEWVYVGEVGTGFREKDAAYLKKTLDKLKTRTPVVPLKGKNYVFAQPTLIAEIEFRGWTGDGNLRHASYKGLREVQDNAAVFERQSRRLRSIDQDLLGIRRPKARVAVSFKSCTNPAAIAASSRRSTQPPMSATWPLLVSTMLHVPSASRLAT